MADGGVYVNSNGDWVRAGGAGGGIDVESERANQLLQGDDAKGWVPGMAMSVVDAVPADTDGEIGDVVFVTGPGDGGSSSSGGGGKVLQVVRATNRDDYQGNKLDWEPIPGMSVTITPQNASSAVIVQSTFVFQTQNMTTAKNYAAVRIVDANNVPISGCEFVTMGDDKQNTVWHSVNMTGFYQPASDAALTFQLEAKCTGSSGREFFVRNKNTTGQMTAYEMEEVKVSP